MTGRPKYALLEIERRWTVDRSRLPSLAGLECRRITDVYLHGGLLRLRKEEGEQVIYKLCKKYGRTSEWSEPITNLYLSEQEYATLSGLPGDKVVKLRYAVEGGALDLYEARPEHVFFEMEFASDHDARRYVPPAFVGDEVTGDPTRTGAAIAAGQRARERF